MDEEDLPASAISQIRDWLEQEKGVRGGEFIPRLAIKFCGGCNPMIDRGTLAQTIRESFTGRVHWVSYEERPDLVLIINGCLTACADEADVKKKSRASLVIQGPAISDIDKNPAPDEAN